MTTFLADVRSVLVPDPEGRHGPLPPILLSMRFVTGLVDAFSTGMAADSTRAGGTGSMAGRRLTSVVAMLVGALAGFARQHDGRAQLRPLVADQLA